MKKSIAKEKYHYCFLYKKLILGGAETLILRMAKELKRRGQSVAVYCETIVPELNELFEDAQVKIIQIKWTRQKISEVQAEKKIFFFSLRDFICGELSGEAIGNGILYVVHPLLLQPNFVKKNRLLEKIFKWSFYDVILKGIERNRIIFMDEVCIDSTKKYWNIHNRIHYDDILRLPIDITDHSFGINAFNNPINILTIARADFPFKGYIKGLISAIYSLRAKKYDVSLTIISYGKDENQICNWINEQAMDSSVSVSITNIGKVDTPKLREYYSKADIYVGMGTTVLEAASYGVPSIAVKPYTYEFLARGLFNDYPEIVEADEELFDGEGILKGLLDSSAETIQNIKKDTYDKVINYYSMDSFWTRIDGIADSRFSVKRRPLVCIWLELWYTYSWLRK